MKFKFLYYTPYCKRGKMLFAVYGAHQAKLITITPEKEVAEFVCDEFNQYGNMVINVIRIKI